MRLEYEPEIGPFTGKVTLDVDVEFERGNTRLVINDVLDGKFSLLLDTEDMSDVRLGAFLNAAGYLIADMAERDPKFLALAVEQRLEDAA